MRRLVKREKGFTLVELAVVLVIIGLIITGVLKAQKMLINSKITATVAQIKDLEAATTNFKDMYSYLPGDLPTTNISVKGCSNGNPYCDVANGDGSIGESNWDMTTYQPGATTCDADVSKCTASNETLLYWYTLLQAGLISGVTNEIVINSNPQQAFGKTHPLARSGGGFWVGNSQNATAGRDPRVGKYTLFGATLTLVKLPTANIEFGDKMGIVTPTVAATMDRKLDDGLPATGSVQAYGYENGTNTSCYGDDDRYQEAVTDLDCGIHIRIQK